MFDKERDILNDKFRSFFHWKFSGVLIPFFWGIALTMLGLLPSVADSKPLLYSAYAFLTAGFAWSIGYWLTCDFLYQINPQYWSLKKIKRATNWAKRAYSIWKYSVFGLLILMFAASLYFSFWINKQIEFKNPKRTEQRNEKNPTVLLRERYDKDFPNYFKYGAELTLMVKGKISKVHYQEYYDFAAKTKFIGMYVPASDCSYCICQNFPDDYKKVMKDLESRIETKSGNQGEYHYTSLQELVFSKRVYIYHEDTFSHQEIASLEKIYEAKGLSVILRGIDYAMIAGASK